MPKSSKRRPPTRRRSAAPSSRREQEPDLEDLLSNLLGDPQPVGFLTHASTLVEVFDGTAGPMGVDLEQFLGMLGQRRTPATTALLTVFDTFLSRRTSVRQVPPSGSLPIWVTHIAETRVSGAALMRDPGGDTDQIVIEVAPVDAPRFSVAVLADHDRFAAIEDAFTMSAPLDEVLAESASIDTIGLRFERIDLADAAARLRESVETTTRVLPQSTSDTWPSTRPLLGWLLRLMPDGGAGWPRHESTPAELRTLTHRVIGRSRRAMTEDEQDVVATFLDYAANRALGDPLRWSPRSTAAAIKWARTHVHADPAWHAAVPTGLAALVHYAHDQRHVPDEMRMEVQHVITEVTGTGGLQQLRAGLERFLPDDRVAPDVLLRRLAQQVGGQDVLDALSPEVEATGVAVPEDVEPRLAELLALIEPVVGTLFADPDLLTVATNLLRRVAAADPALLQRRSDPRALASAATWIVLKVNDAFDGQAVKEVPAAFGITASPSVRATALLKPLGLDAWLGPTGSFLGDAGLLTGSKRRAIIEARDRARAGTAADEGFPTEIVLAGGGTARVERRPGMAAEVLEDVRPYLAAQGVDLSEVQDLDSVRTAMDSAVASYNAALSTTTGPRREAALHALRLVSRAVSARDDTTAIAVLDSIEPQATGPAVPEVSAVIGLGLELLDRWLGDARSPAPIGLAKAVRVPEQWRKRARTSREIIAMASQGRAMQSDTDLIRRHGGRRVLDGTVIAVAATLDAWAHLTGRMVDDVSAEQLG